MLGVICFITALFAALAALGYSLTGAYAMAAFYVLIWAIFALLGINAVRNRKS